MRPLTIALIAALLLAGPLTWAQDNAPQADPAVQAQQVIDKAIEYLKSQQRPDGAWHGEKDPPGITALVLRAVVRDPKVDRNADWVKKGFDRLLAYQWDTGGIYKDLYANYNTSVAISALTAAENPAYKEAIDKAVTYLKRLQWTENTTGPEGETIPGDSHPWYGGWGYGRQGRPDGSNMHMAVDALKDAGLPPDDPAFQAALKFVTRMQNLSETNDQPWAGDDGGFIYTPANNGESQAGEYVTPDGQRRLRSYGSLTYAGLKTMVYAGLTKEDPRVKAAWDWITRNWTLDENPGMSAGNPANARQGMFYYYLALARSLNAYDEPIVVTPQQHRHDWRVELIQKLASLQRPDGSFVGERRWMEDNPVLTTAYVVLALQEAQEDLRQHPAK